jgi:ribosomal protein S18 acetylase RimI-like enzyme
MEIVIEEAKLDDALEISKIAKETFVLACPKKSDVHEIKAYSEKNLNPSNFQKLICAQSSCVICAFVNDELAGFVVLEFGSICPDTPSLKKPVKLQKFYVKAKFHGTKVTGKLMEEAKNVCIKEKYTDIWLSVFSKNERAIRFYSKFKFVAVGTTNFTMGSETHLDNLMVAKIV